jgi:hypothetical protein
VIERIVFSGPRRCAPPTPQSWRLAAFVPGAAAWMKIGKGLDAHYGRCCGSNTAVRQNFDAADWETGGSGFLVSKSVEYPNKGTMGESRVYSEPMI